MKSRFAEFVRDYPGRLALPIGAYAGLELSGGTVRQIVTSAEAQVRTVLALHDRFQTPVMLTAMDLSAEAEAFGCPVRMPENEIPMVTGRRVSSLDEIEAMPQPAPGDKRTAVHLETARRLAQTKGSPLILGSMIGPFSLACRIFGMSETLEATALQPETVLALLERTTLFLSAYALAFRERGAAGVVMAEPAAGLLSPAGLARFSAAFVKRVADRAGSPEFTIILHNCGAKLVHLEKTFESGASVYHFGAPMDIVEALRRAGGRYVLGGNLDPAAVFHAGTPESVRQATRALLEATKNDRNFFISSGCDIPPGTPLASLDAFYQTVRECRI